MHDPMTQAFKICFPWWTYRPWPRGVKKWEDMTPRQRRRRDKHWKEGYRESWLTIWHVDPCKMPGAGDDSCGWFMRSYHGDKDVLEKIVKRFADDWDRVFVSEDTGKRYECGYFLPSGKTYLSVIGITLNLFFLAAAEHFESMGLKNARWGVARRWMQKHLFDIMLFTENPTDSLHDAFVMKWGGENKREERIRTTASCIYGWILRETRPWYRHPRWHIHHWKIDWHFGHRLLRWWKRRCKRCGGRISVKDNGVVADGWGVNTSLTCGKCSGISGPVDAVAKQAKV